MVVIRVSYALVTILQWNNEHLKMFHKKSERIFIVFEYFWPSNNTRHGKYSIIVSSVCKCPMPSVKTVPLKYIQARKISVFHFLAKMYTMNLKTTMQSQHRRKFISFCLTIELKLEASSCLNLFLAKISI